MRDVSKKHGLILIILFLLFVSGLLVFTDWQNSHRGFTFAMLDIGQGDALFIESPTGTQVLVDAGPPRKILSELTKVMPYFDRSIDAIIITNPDQDHIGGIADILESYKVGEIFESGTWSDSKTYQNLEKEIADKKIPDILAKKGMLLDLGSGAVIDIIFPDQDVTNWSTNDGSTVARLSYGNIKIMLTGDATQKTEEIILEDNKKEDLKSDILKIGHHGSRYSTSEEFLKTVSPTYALISVGKDNKYGHPSPEIIGRLEQFGTKILRTDESGTIILKSDGKSTTFNFLK